MTKLFDKYDTKNIVVNDLSLRKYIYFDEKLIPHSFGRHTKKTMGKSKISVVERLINKIMRSGQGKRRLSGNYIRNRRATGKKFQAINIVKDAFEIIDKKTGKNPVQLLVQAIENSAPREDTTRIKRGGISYTEAVDVSPLHRIDEALKNIGLACFASSFNSKKSAAEALAEEIILAAENSNKSFAIKRKEEIERIAKSSR